MLEILRFVLVIILRFLMPPPNSPCHMAALESDREWLLSDRTVSTVDIEVALRTLWQLAPFNQVYPFVSKSSTCHIAKSTSHLI
jgi:hypothetical protein